MSRVTYSPPPTSARVWPRPSDRIPALGRRVASAGRCSVLSGTSTIVGGDAVIDVRDSRSSEDELLWAGETETEDVLALLDALDSGTSFSHNRSSSSNEHTCAALVSSDEDVDDDDGESSEDIGQCDDVSHRVVQINRLAARGRAWAERVAARDANLPGAVDSTSPPPTNSPSMPQASSASQDHHIIVVSSSSSSPQDHEIVVEDVFDGSSSADSFDVEDCLESYRRVNRDILHAEDEQHQRQQQHQHQQQQQQQQQHQSLQPHPLHQHQPIASTSSSKYDLSAAFEHSRNRFAPSDQSPTLPSPSHSLHDVTLDLAYSRASLATLLGNQQSTRYGPASSSSSSAAATSHSDCVAPAAVAAATVQSRFHLPGFDIGRSMQPLWSLQATWDETASDRPQSCMLPPPAGDS